MAWKFGLKVFYGEKPVFRLFVEGVGYKLLNNNCFSFFYNSLSRFGIKNMINRLFLSKKGYTCLILINCSVFERFKLYHSMDSDFMVTPKTTPSRISFKKPTQMQANEMCCTSKVAKLQQIILIVYLFIILFFLLEN